MSEERKYAVEMPDGEWPLKFGGRECRVIRATAVRALRDKMQDEIDRLTKELCIRDFVEARKSSVASSYGGYKEIKDALDTEIAMHAAWCKRAEEAESELAAEREKSERLAKEIDRLKTVADNASKDYLEILPLAQRAEEAELDAAAEREKSGKAREDALREAAAIAGDINLDSYECQQAVLALSEKKGGDQC